MPWLDDIIAWISPRAGVQRTRARRALRLLNSYDGASLGRRTSDWRPQIGSANAAVGPAMIRLRNRARDIVRNNPHATQALESLVGNLVGTGIVARSKAATASTRRRHQDIWQAWAEEADYYGELDLYGLQALSVRTMVESGEVLVRFRAGRPGRSGVPLRLQVLEPDHLDEGRDGPIQNGGYIMHGVEFDADGRRTGYWMHAAHPGESWRAGRPSMESHRIPASEVLHLYRKRRPGQVRDVTWFASILLTLRDLDEYAEAELVRKKIESCLVGGIISEIGDTSPLPPAIGTDTKRDQDGVDREYMEPGLLTRLRPGEDIKFNTPPGSQAYGPFEQARLRAVAAGLGVTYEQLTGDLTRVNYSSIRAGLVEYRRKAEQTQWLTIIPMLCTPIWQRFQTTAWLTGALRRAEYGVEWSPPRWDWVDPAKDVQAARSAIEGRLVSLSETIRQLGYDPDEVFDEIADDLRKLRERGIAPPEESTGTRPEGASSHAPAGNDEPEDATLVRRLFGRR